MRSGMWICLWKSFLLHNTLQVLLSGLFWIWHFLFVPCCWCCRCRQHFFLMKNHECLFMMLCFFHEKLCFFCKVSKCVPFWHVWQNWNIIFSGLENVSISVIIHNNSLCFTCFEVWSLKLNIFKMHLKSGEKQKF